MKVFKKFVDDSGAYGVPIDAKRKPVFRSSAIFPVINRDWINSRILFMGYWILKREIQEVALLYTLRSEAGNLISRKSLTINSPRAYSIEISDLLKEAGIKNEFIGSIEIEVFTARDMVFPYPAFVLEYFDAPRYSSYVHTTGRVFNDTEDLNDTNDFVVPESGFEINCTHDSDAFFAFVCGPLPNNSSITVEVTNQKNEKRTLCIREVELHAYQTSAFFIKKYFPEIITFLDGKSGTATIRHSLKGFFPRFLAGNINSRLLTASLTHTYYDCSSLDHESCYMSSESDELYHSSIYAPVFLENGRGTEIVFYPTYSPSSYVINLALLDKNGNTLQKFDGYRKVNDGENKYFKIDIGRLVNEAPFHPTEVAGVFITKNWENSGKIPNRLKFGLNVKSSEVPDELSSNICFNSELGIKKTLLKQGTRKWAPINNNGETIIVINNSSTLKEYDRWASLSCKIFRETDDQYLEINIRIPPYGQHRINILEDDEIRCFIGNRPGWIYVDSDNQFINAWYFTFGKCGLVGADHSF